jgi:hypothetical protein
MKCDDFRAIISRLAAPRQPSSGSQSASHGARAIGCRVSSFPAHAMPMPTTVGEGRIRRIDLRPQSVSLADDKLMGDLPNEIEATQIGGFRSDCVIAGKLAPGSFGVLQQYQPEAAIPAQLPRAVEPSASVASPAFGLPNGCENNSHFGIEVCYLFWTARGTIPVCVEF